MTDKLLLSKKRANTKSRVPCKIPAAWKNLAFQSVQNIQFFLLLFLLFDFYYKKQSSVPIVAYSTVSILAQVPIMAHLKIWLNRARHTYGKTFCG